MTGRAIGVVLARLLGDLSTVARDAAALCRLTRPSSSARSQPAEPHRLELRGSTGPAFSRAVPAPPGTAVAG